jgi:hypothetical protein
MWYATAKAQDLKGVIGVQDAVGRRRCSTGWGENYMIKMNKK